MGVEAREFVVGGTEVTSSTLKLLFIFIFIVFSFKTYCSGIKMT